eukprot:16071540-Heterocapsa_arctica.AAC.1
MQTGAWCAWRRRWHPVRRLHGGGFLRHILVDDHNAEEQIEDPYVVLLHASAYLAVPLGATQAPE